MTRVFADSNYWVELLNLSDELHTKAVAAAERYSDAQIVTSEMVLTEVLNGFSGSGPGSRRAASKAARALRHQPNVVVVPQSSEQFERALDRYQARLDKSWSLTDCASFLIMEDEGIEAALTHDQHSLQAGLRALLRQAPAKAAAGFFAPSTPLRTL